MTSASSRGPSGFKVHAMAPYTCSARFVSNKASRASDVTCIKCLRRMPCTEETAARIEELARVRAPIPRFSVYALELPDGDVYVGSTAKPVRERLAEHRVQHGPRTRLLGSVQRGVSRPDVERQERAVAADLRRMRYKVRQG